MATDKKAYRREYMRWYMAKRRKATGEPPKVTRKAYAADFVGPPCPENLPDRPTDGRHFSGQIELLKAQLAHTLLLWQESCEELAMQVEMLTFENETLQAQAGDSQAEKPNLPALPTPTQAKTSPAPPPASPKEPELDQYLRDKAQGFVDPDRKPTSADDHMPAW